MIQKRTTKGGLTRTDTSCYGNKTLSLINPVKQVIKRLLVKTAQEKVSWVRG